MKHLAFLILSIFHSGSFASGLCSIGFPNREGLVKPRDNLFQLLQTASDCPQSIMELEELLIRAQWDFSTYMVANRGYHNPDLGSFSFFESVNKQGGGEIFVGHFTEKQGNTLQLQQEPVEGSLLIEAIAWDLEKGGYNFYELIGQGGLRARWFYRGDSFDALADNQYLHRTPPQGTDKFGGRMRCSACHNSGEPIMKELAAPHNDWWTEARGLPFGDDVVFDRELKKRVDRLIDASNFSERVSTGIKKLHDSDSYQRALRARSLQEQLRPLFCTTEINIESSDARVHGDDRDFTIPSTFIVHPLLGAPSLKFSVVSYRALLETSKFRFPENNDLDADHAWLTPVVSWQDRLAVDALIEEGVISKKHAMDILMVDFTRPLLSKQRCQLLALVPNRSADWMGEFEASLARLNAPHAQSLLKNLRNENSEIEHGRVVEEYVAKLDMAEHLPNLLQGLLTARKKVFTDEISKNPLGQILEPGFRVIFPAEVLTF